MTFVRMLLLIAIIAVLHRDTTARTAPPTKAPTRAPTRIPTRIPTRVPTKAPSRAPSRTPSKAPSRAPSKAPSKAPSRVPSETPSRAPIYYPSSPPTGRPSSRPTSQPSQNRNIFPTRKSKYPATKSASSNSSDTSQLVVVSVIGVILVIIAVYVGFLKSFEEYDKSAKRFNTDALICALENKPLPARSRMAVVLFDLLDLGYGLYIDDRKRYDLIRELDEVISNPKSEGELRDGVISCIAAFQRSNGIAFLFDNSFHLTCLIDALKRRVPSSSRGIELVVRGVNHVPVVDAQSLSSHGVEISNSATWGRGLVTAYRLGENYIPLNSGDA